MRTRTDLGNANAGSMGLSWYFSPFNNESAANPKNVWKTSG